MVVPSRQCKRQNPIICSSSTGGFSSKCKVQSPTRCSSNIGGSWIQCKKSNKLLIQPQVVLQSAGFTGGDGMPTKCKVDYFDLEAIFCVIHLEKLIPTLLLDTLHHKERYEVTLEISNQDLSQWRIKVQVL